MIIFLELRPFPQSASDTPHTCSQHRPGASRSLSVDEHWKCPKYQSEHNTYKGSFRALGWVQTLISFLILNFLRHCRHFQASKIFLHEKGLGLSFLREAAPNSDAQLGHRIIFVITQITWLVQIPDMALCYSFLCGIFFAEIRIIKALTHEKLNEVTSNFVASLDNKEPSETLGLWPSLQKTGGSCSGYQLGKLKTRATVMW